MKLKLARDESPGGMVTVSIGEELLPHFNGYSGSQCLLQLTPKFCLSRTKVTYFRSPDINFEGKARRRSVSVGLFSASVL
jgi:hypothetical protein